MQMQYFLKAQFHFNKDQFADLMTIAGIAGAVSQLILMPLLTPLMGEEKMLSVGLFFACAHVRINPPPPSLLLTSQTISRHFIYMYLVVCRLCFIVWLGHPGYLMLQPCYPSSPLLLSLVYALLSLCSSPFKVVCFNFDEFDCSYEALHRNK